MPLPSVDKEKCRIITPQFRVSYPHVFKAQAMKGSTNAPKFSVTMLFKKSLDLTAVKDAMTQAKIIEWGEDRKQWPKGILNPVGDGDAPKHASKAGYAGHWAIKASSKEENRPGVFDENVEPIIEPSAFYPGCYARASVFAFAWEYMGKTGVSFILDHVQKLKDGEAFGGKKPGKQVFAPVGEAVGGFEDEADDGEDEDSFL